MSYRKERLAREEQENLRRRRTSLRNSWGIAVFFVCFCYFVNAAALVQKPGEEMAANPDSPALSGPEIPLEEEWYLVLPQKEGDLPPDFSLETAEVEGVAVDRRIASELTALLEDARAAGFELSLLTGFSQEKEESGEETPPAALDHATGLAVDFC